MIDKIKGLRKYTDCSMPSNEKERLHKAEVSAYNQAIEDVVKLFAIPDIRHQVCPLCEGIGSGHFEGDSQVFTCDSCDGTGKIAYNTR